MLALALAAALAPLCLLNFRVRKVIREGGVQTWILIVWPAAACLMYALVLFSFRYVAGLHCAGRYRRRGPPAAAVPRRHRIRALFAAALLLVVVGTVRLRPILQEAFRPAAGGFLSREEDRDNQPPARRSHRDWPDSGYGRETRSACSATASTVTTPASPGCGSWPRSGKTRSRWPAWTPPGSTGLVQLRQIGVKALVSRSKPGFVNDEGWAAIPRTNIYIRML